MRSRPLWSSRDTSNVLRRLLAVSLTLLMLGSAATVGVAVASSTASAASTSDSSAITESNPVKFVYVDTGIDTQSITFMTENGTKVPTNKTGDIVGSMADLDGDGMLEIPYVTSQQQIYIVDANNETQFIAEGTGTSGTKVSVGNWTGDSIPEILYANTSDNSHIYYANVTGAPTEISSEQASSVLGAVDFDGDSTRDIVYTGMSQNLKYYNSSGVTDTQKSIGSAGAAGTPQDFFQNDTSWVPTMDGSTNPELWNANGTVYEIHNRNNHNIAPVAGANWSGTAQLEYIHLKNNNIHYTNITSGETVRLNDSDGNSISALKSAGIAGVANLSSSAQVGDASINATAVGQQNVSINVTSSEALDSLEVSLSGPASEGATLTLSEFDGPTGSGPYTYNFTYDGRSDGDYTASIGTITANSVDGFTGDFSDAAVVDDLEPNVTNVTLTETKPAADDDDIIGPGESVTVTADVTGDYDASTVTASATDIGIDGAVMQSSNGQFTLETTAADNDVSKSVTATVSASDGQGNSDSANSASVTVDTVAPNLPAVSNRTVNTGDSVNLNASNTTDASAIESYEWDFGNGQNATGATPSVTYSSTGTYDVTLTVTDDAGNTATERASVTVESDSSGGYYGGGGSSSDSDDDGSDSGSSTGDSGSAETTTTSIEDTTTTTTTSTDTTTTTASTDDESMTDDSDRTTTDASETTTESATGTETTSSSSPGFGVLIAVVALLGAALLVARRD
jgi:PGF-CTERM protein